jgi:hypothetical protein
MMKHEKEFVQWIRAVINPQATNGNNVSVDDYAKDGMSEYNYPERFTVNGDHYWWSYGTHHTKGRHLCTHYELWFHGPAFRNSRRIATGPLTKTALRNGLRVIYEFYKSTVIEPNPILSTEYWDCECNEGYIHPNSVAFCPLCGAERARMPDSHQREVDEGTHFAVAAKPIYNIKSLE